MRDIDYAIDAWSGELARLGRSPHTRRKYNELLWKFSVFAGAKDCDEITPEDCRRFLDQWVDASPGTLALQISILKGFFKFLVNETVLEQSPMRNINRPPRKRAEDLDVVTVAESDVEKLFNACREWDELLAIAMLAYLGPRRSALARLRRRDLDLERGTVRFREKGSKVIVKPIPHELAEILRAAEAANLWIGPEDYIVPNRRATKSKERSSKVIYRIITDVAKRARVRTHVHALRAAFAVRFLETHEGDLVALKNLMGHSRSETTEVYLRRLDKAQTMERVRDLSWGPRVSALSADAPNGIRTRVSPHIPETDGVGGNAVSSLPIAVQRRLDELREASARSRETWTVDR